ncbi:MAG: hypothetical protein Kow0099_36870 [Candidatus Abyssubacteria bacterium]
MSESRKGKRPPHLGIGHFWIGKRDGVNVVIRRNVESLLELESALKITLFGKVSNEMGDICSLHPDRVRCINIDEFDPGYEIPGLPRKTISEQKIQDYMWHGANIMEILARKLKPMDTVLVENLGIGINPAVTYAFYLYLQYCQHHHPRKRIFYRAHDFLQQRARNFENLKKFQDAEIPLVPNWHEIIYPNYTNVGYITINTSDIGRLIEHGIDRERIAYVPNCIDDSLLIDDDEHKNLRARLIEKFGLQPDVRFILYPVRCVKRKNVEEAVFVTCLLNTIAEQKIVVNGMTLQGKFHLLIGVKPDSEEDIKYVHSIEQFARKNKLPVTIGIEDLVTFEREIDPRKMEIVRYAIGDAFNMADIVITTSYLEGFGFAFIEPWYLGKAVIGRNIPAITYDFERAGVNLDHLYNVFRINGEDFRSIGYQDKERVGLERRLKEILNLRKKAYVEKVIASNEFSIRAMISFLMPEGGKAIIERNRNVVASTYSQRSVAERLWDVLTHLPLRPTR